MAKGAGTSAITLACEKPYIRRDCLDAVSYGEAGDIAASEELIRFSDKLDYEEAEERKVILGNESLI